MKHPQKHLEHRPRYPTHRLMNLLASRWLKWPLLTLLILGSLAFAFEYRIDSQGGPDTLRARITRAYNRWQEVEGSEVSARETEDAANLITYGDGPSFGPDTLSLTVQHTPAGTTEVLLNPSEPSDRALTHELGLLAGLSAAPLTRSVMNPVIPPESNAALPPADETALRALTTFKPEDINQDGVVDFYDLAELGSAFGESGINLPADIDENGVVDRADVSRLRTAYTFSAPAETAPAGTLGEMSGGTASGGTMSGGTALGGPVSGGAVSGTMSGGAASGGAVSGGTMSGGAPAGSAHSDGTASGGGL